MNLPKNTIVQYVRKSNGQPYGVIVAVRRPDGEVSVDFSLCNTKKDKFSKERALEIAVGRALNSKKDDGSNRLLPRSLYREVEAFNKRVSKYYRTHIDEVVTW
jgi:hypothetical protein